MANKWTRPKFLCSITMTSHWARGRLQSPASRVFTQPLFKAQIKEKNQSSASLAFVRGIHRWPVNSPAQGLVTRKMFPFDNVIMSCMLFCYFHCCCLFLACVFFYLFVGFFAFCLRFLYLLCYMFCLLFKTFLTVGRYRNEKPLFFMSIGVGLLFWYSCHIVNSR